MKRTAWVLAATAALLLGLAPGPAEAAGCHPKASCTHRTRASVIPSWQARMLDEVNSLRRAVGARPLTLCPALTEAAQDYAQTMAMTGHYGHVGVDGSLPWDRMKAHGYSWTGAAENIAGGYNKVPVVMQAWHDSSGHYVNLVNPALQHVGFGKATIEGSPLGTYWVQDFAAGGHCR